MNNISKDNLLDFVKSNEVVYQAFGDLVEVANTKETENRKALIDYLTQAASVEVYPKGHSFIKNDFAELDGWSTDEDVLFLLQPIGVLICVPKKDALEKNLIEAA